MMLSRIVKTLCLLVCLGALFPVSIHAEPRIVSPAKKRIEAQKDDNKKWEKEAKKRESELIKIADDYYKKKLYRKAADYYKRVVDLRYKEWDFPQTRSSVRPAYKTVSVRLYTNNTRRARDRLEKIGEQIATQVATASKKDLNNLFERAEVEMLLGNVVEAYIIYAQVVEAAESIGKKKYAVEAAIKARNAQAAIVKEAAKALEAAQKLLAAGKINEAAKSLDDFEIANRPLISISIELATQLKKLRDAPEFEGLKRAQRAQQRLERGNSAFRRGSYVTARRYYREISDAYPGTDAARTAEEKLVKMMSDAKIQSALKKQEADEKCAPLMARARALVKYTRLAEVVIIAEKIIADYPGTVWAIEAAKLLKAIESAKPATPATE